MLLWLVLACFGEQQQNQKDYKEWKPPAQRALIVKTIEVGSGSVARLARDDGSRAC